MQKLLRRIPPKTGESYHGYIERLAIGNHIQPEDFLCYSEEVFRYPATKIIHKDLLSKLLVALTGFENISSLFDVRTIGLEYKKLFDIKRQKVCVCCLEEQKFLRSVWNFKNYIVCHIHESCLLTECPNCKSKLNARAVLLRQCIKCDTPLPRHTDAKESSDSLSEYIALNFDESEDSLPKIAGEIQQIQPYIRLANNGRFEDLEALRFGEPVKFSALQKRGNELLANDKDSIDTFIKHIKVRLAEKGLSSVFNSYRYITSNPDEYLFANVLKRTVLERTDDIGDESLSIELLANLWKLDITKLTNAIKDAVPSENLINKGRLKITCAAFSKYQEKIITTYRKL